MAYLGKSPSQGVRNRYYFTASGGETSISGALTGGTLTFTDGNYVDVNLNGVTLVAGTDYNTSTANTIAGLSALTASDVVEIVVYDVFSVFSGNVNSDFSVGGNLSVTGTTVFTGATTITGLTTTGDINFGDNDKAIFGAGSDLQIYHDGSNSYISEGGTGNLFLGATNLFLRSSTGETYIGAIQDGAVSLYHDNSVKLATTSTGVDVTGNIDFSGGILASNGSVQFVMDKDNNGGEVFVWGHNASNATTNELMRLDSSGNLLVGKASLSGTTAGLQFKPAGELSVVRDGNHALILNRQTSDGNLALFQKSATTVGSISVTASGTTYNTTSDIRLKTDIAPISDATDKLMQMNPVSYAWKVDPDGPRSMGFIAQQMQEVMPEAVSTGDDDDAMMSMDYGRITPILVSALQDAHRKIEQLESRLAAMENN